MATVVTIDKAGRIVIPKDARGSQKIRPGAKFLLVKGRNGTMCLQRLDPDELARQVHEELKGVDLEPIIAKVKAEVERLALSSYPTLRRKRARA